MALWSNTDADASKPKYLNTTDKNATLGVSVAEAQQTASKAKGINSPGWVKYTTYTDAQGNTRNKAEVLVAMGSITGDNDTLLPTTITITEQPVNQTITDGETANFAVDYAPVSGVTFTIKWQVSVNGGTAWTDIAGETAFDLQVASGAAEYVDGNQFRAVITGGSATATSDAATLTINPV